ncbi:AMP-binding protein [Streptomyces sp. NPDC002033]|uniref:AMP-binding protein n=1 Tax=Streptomyces sp. NPDC002033 TaxID=3154533 RepID=UPI0033229294
MRAVRPRAVLAHTKDIPVSATIHGGIAAAAALHPDAVALRYGDGLTVGYGELDAAANRFAAELLELRIGEGDFVPVLVPPGPVLPAVLLAVLKTGAAYVALPVDWPAGRLQQIADRCGAPVLIVGEGVEVTVTGRASVRVPSGVTALAADRSGRPVPAAASANSPACVFFTSGSTGEPKGAVSPHAATLRLFTPTPYSARPVPPFGDCPDLFPGQAPIAHFGPRTVTLRTSSVAWDLASMENWAPLLNGGSVTYGAPGPLTPAALREAVEVHGVNTLTITPSLLNTLVDEDPRCFDGIAQVLTGGERMSAEHARRLLTAHPALHLVNGYGPVECTILATAVRIHDVAALEGAVDVPIGTALPGTLVLVLRADGAVAGRGETGEIWLGGPGLVHEYLGDPRQTARQFVETPLPAEVTGLPDGTRVRLYRTGDLGVLDEAGMLWYRGRGDRQLKIRGVRVEPAETEAALRREPGVRDAAVVALRDAQERPVGLAAWVTGDEGLDVTALRERLVALLPGPLAPRWIGRLDAYPRNGSGKTDYPELERRAVGQATRADGSRPAAGPGEELVAAVFATVLGAPRAWSDTHLIHSGGDSLAAVRIAHRLTLATGRRVTAADVLSAPLVARLAARIPELPRASGGAPGADGGAESAESPLSAGQIRIWLTEQFAPGCPQNLVHRTTELEGPLDVTALRAALGDVIDCHPSLRTVYLEDEDGDPFQRVLPPGGVPPLDEVRIPAAGLPARARAAAAAPVDLTTGPLLRLTVLHDPQAPGRAVAVLAVHHIAVDGWSLPVIVEDLRRAYEARSRGDAPALPAESVGYTAWHRAEAATADPAERERRGAVWRAELAGVQDVPQQVPPRTPGTSGGGAAAPGAAAAPGEDVGVIAAPVPAPAAAAVRDTARSVAATPAVVLLSLFAQAVSDVTGARRFCVAVPVAGRSDPALARTVGFCVNTLPVRVDTEPGGDPLALVPVLRERFLRALRDELPFNDIVAAVGGDRGHRMPLVQVCLAYQTDADPVLTLPPARSRPAPTPAGDGGFELTWELWPARSGADGPVAGTVQFRAEAFPAATARALRERIAALLSALDAPPKPPRPAESDITA